MIVTEQKPLDEILDFLSPYTSILIAGCDGCTQPTRGLKEAEVLAQLLELGGRQKGKNFKFKVISLTKQCDSYLIATELKPQIEDIGAILSLGCGIGVQTIAEVFPDTIVLPAQNTTFIGMENREEGAFWEYCAACGDCLLEYTGGICPIARCAKHLLNGPCGGSQNGKCEINPEKPCAWQLIIDRLAKIGRLDLLEEIKPPRNWNINPTGRLSGLKS
jgi:hypothetical protein